MTGRSRSDVPEFRRLLARYAPFLRELARRPECCQTILADEIALDESLAGDPGDFLPLVRDLRLPVREPYSDWGWAEVLAEVRFGGGSLEALNLSLWERIFCEIQFALSNVVEVAFVDFRPHASRPRVGELIAAACDPAFRRFRQRIRRRRPREFELRVFFYQRRETLPNNIEAVYSGTELRRLRLAGARTVELPPGRRTTRILRGVADRVIDLLSEEIQLGSEAGRGPKTEDWARWWAAAVFDGLTPSQIAASDSDVDTSDQAASDRMLTHVETITTALRRLGVAQPAG